MVDELVDCWLNAWLADETSSSHFIPRLFFSISSVARSQHPNFKFLSSHFKITNGLYNMFPAIDEILSSLLECSSEAGIIEG